MTITTLPPKSRKLQEFDCLELELVFGRVSLSDTAI